MTGPFDGLYFELVSTRVAFCHRRADRTTCDCPAGGERGGVMPVATAVMA